jgi:hypothetical protein
MIQEMRIAALAYELIGRNKTFRDVFEAFEGSRPVSARARQHKKLLECHPIGWTLLYIPRPILSIPLGLSLVPGTVRSTTETVILPG